MVFYEIHDQPAYDDQTGSDSDDEEIAISRVISMLPQSDCCEICLDTEYLEIRSCCKICICQSCLKLYYENNLFKGLSKLECCNPVCKKIVTVEELKVFFSDELIERHKNREMEDSFHKSCPKCYLLTEVESKKTKKVTCLECGLEWCFRCHCPWHTDKKCSSAKEKDVKFQEWANDVLDNQPKAQRCPKCKIFIERITGCPLFKCALCQTTFCYLCGGRLYKNWFLGSHSSRFSIFGCKSIYKKDKPIQRKLIRATLLCGKIVFGTVSGCLIILVLAASSIPLLPALLIYRKVRKKKPMV